MKTFKQFLKEEKIVSAYHYSSAKFNSFDTSFLHGGHDRRGPGLYASTEHETNHGENLHHIKLDTSKFVKPGQKVNRRIIKDLIHNSPHLEDVASNYDENHHVGVRKLIDACANAPDMHEALERVWYDGYRADNKAYLDNVGQHFHGSITKPHKFRPSVTHYVIWHPHAIKSITHNE